MTNANSNGRTFEVYYRDGGHCGPFPNLFQAIRFSIRNVLGRHKHPGCVIRDRRIPLGFTSGCVAVVEIASVGSVDVTVLDNTGYFPARQSFSINLRGQRNKELRRG